MNNKRYVYWTRDITMAYALVGQLVVRRAEIKKETAANYILMDGKRISKIPNVGGRYAFLTEAEARAKAVAISRGKLEFYEKGVVEAREILRKAEHEPREVWDYEIRRDFVL